VCVHLIYIQYLEITSQGIEEIQRFFKMCK